VAGHVLDAEFSSRGFTRTVLKYEALVENSREELKPIMRLVAADGPKSSALVLDEIERSITAGLRHHAAAAGNFAARDDVFPWLRDTYDAYERLRHDGRDQHAMATLDRVRLAFDIACEAFAPAFRGVPTPSEAGPQLSDIGNADGADLRAEPEATG
jgi:hypothetical protein